MRTTFQNLLRMLVVALALGFATTPIAQAIGPGDGEPPRARRETLWGLPRDDPAIAVGAIVGGLTLIIVLAWLAARMGDKS